MKDEGGKIIPGKRNSRSKYTEIGKGEMLTCCKKVLIVKESTIQMVD